jgi:hypothetical protein
MTLIRKPYELSVQTRIKALIYGQAGMGKTTLALSAPKPLLLDFDGGVHRVNYGHQQPTVQITSWKDCEAVLKEDLSEYETLIIDTAGKMLDFMAEDIIARNPKMGKSNGSLALQGYGERKGAFRQFVKSVMMMNKHLIFVAHRDSQKNGDEIRYVPMFGGSSYDDLVTELDLVGYLEADGRKRKITFDPTDRNDGKNTCNLPAIMELPIVVDTTGVATANTFLQTSVINPYIANLQKRVETAAAFNKVIEELKEAIALVTDEVSANDFISRVDNFEHVGNSKAMASQLLNAKCISLGLKFNSKIKGYEKAAA